jgi:hypothetical protein
MGLKFVQVESSNVDEIAYDEITQELHVCFKNNTHYVYEGVPESMYVELLLTESVGKYLAREIKNVYPYRKEM